MQKVKILFEDFSKFSDEPEEQNYIHVTYDLDSTLCGDVLSGDETLGLEGSIKIDDKKNKISCPKCINIISLCKSIKKSEIKL